MSMTTFEPLLRDAVIRAVDTISKRAAQTEKAAEGAIARLLKRWNEMSTLEKENVAGIVIATATTAVGAIAAIRGGMKRKAKKTARKKVKKAVKKLV
ncbi:MAG: hypothetical protein ACXW29_13830 [Thermoanaerobaculia bacterium]